MDPTKDRPEGDLTDLEFRLRQWQPSSLGLDRDRMLFEAGRAAARAEVWGWVPLGSIAALMMLAIGLGVLFAREQGECLALQNQIMQLTEPPIEPGPASVPAPIVERPPAPDSYLVLTHTMLSAGPEMMPAPAPDTTPVIPSPNDEPPLRVRGSSGLINF